MPVERAVEAMDVVIEGGLLSPVPPSPPALKPDAPFLAPTASVEAGVATATPKKDEDDEDNEEDVTSKSQVMTLMTVDVDRVADFSFHSFSLVSSVFALRTPVDFG